MMQVKERRSCVGPNEHFIQALTRYEDELRPAERRGEPPTYSLQAHYVSTLIDMGFDKENATAAVANSNGRFELAVSFCLSGV